METFDAQPRGWEEGPNLLQSAWRYKWLIAVAALLGVLAGYGWAARQPTLYEGVSQVLLTGTANFPASGDAPPQPVGDPERYLENQATLIGTTPVLELAAKRTKGRASVDDLRERMSVEVEQDADLISIVVLDENARDAATLANALAEGYEEFVEGQPGRMAIQLRSNRTKLETRLARVNAELGDAPDNASLQRRRGSLVKELQRIEDDLAAVEASAGTDLVYLELGVAPEQPAQPATRRIMAVGLLFGLVASVALAWWLNTRRWAQESRTEWEWSGPPEALPTREGDVTPDGQGWASPESLVLAGRRPDTVVNGNGTRGPSAIARLMQRIARQHDTKDPNAVPNRARRNSSAPHGMVDDRFSTTVSENGEEASLTRLLVRLDKTLASEPLDYYTTELPQAIAEEIPADVPADMVAVLLDDGEGSFRVAGSVGLDADERDAIVSHNHEQLRQALWDGVIVLQGTDPPGTAATGVPGAQTVEALIILPLVQGSTWLGMLLLGRRVSKGRDAILFSDDEIANALLCGMELASLVQSLLLAKRLRECLGAFEPSSDRS